ncbi:MAG: mechanosensitive ion channel [Woeseiaceae bacterium]|nr:mechanosensitive ion channel [Woeseiaceae bacterium]
MSNEIFSAGQIGEFQDGLLEWLASRLGEDLGVLLVTLFSAVTVLVLAWSADVLARRVLRRVLERLAKRMDSQRADAWQLALRDKTLARRSAHLVGALTVYLLTPYALYAYPEAAGVVRTFVKAYLILVVVIALNAFLQAAADVMREDLLKVGVPSRFVSQTLQLGVWIVGGVLIVSVLTDLPVAALLTGMAGMTAVLLVVFRDSLLGYVAGVQIVNNDLVREGDWIEIPKYGADGDVTDIGLVTVKVRNWDNTVSTVPTYALISEGLKNWRGMQASGGRRIKRSINVNLEDVAFCTDETLEGLRSYAGPGLDPGVLSKAVDQAVAAEGAGTAGLTNIAVYCEYLREYLRRHPHIRKDLTSMVRVLPIGSQGLPIEIYCFSAVIEWTPYERVLESVMEHAVTVMPVFGLRPFQLPANLAPSTTKPQAH